MIFLEKFKFKSTEVRKELKKFKRLLGKKDKILKEIDDVKNLFVKNKNLSALFSKIDGHIPDYLSFEPQIQELHQCDLVIGSSKTGLLTFIEFEPAQERSLFKAKPKNAPYWGNDFEHGFGQISDWFYAIDGIEKSEPKKLNFKVKDYKAYLIVGRRSFIDNQFKRKRLEWRAKNVRVNQREIVIITYDELYESFLLHC